MGETVDPDLATGLADPRAKGDCPSCARPVTSDDVHAAPNRFPVDGIVAFGLDQASADKGVRIYLPFFTFDADTVTDYKGSKGTDRTRTVTDSKGHLHTEHYIDGDHVEGMVRREIDDVPVTAESSVDPDRMRDSLQQCQVDARARMEELDDQSVKADIGGDHQKISSEDIASSTSTPLQQNLQPSEDLEQGRAADAPVTYTAQQCSDAVISYRFDTPDTYFPAVPACANLSATERTQLARELFAQDQISAARQALLAVPRGASQRDICRTTLVMSAARVAAHRNRVGHGRCRAGLRGGQQCHRQRDDRRCRGRIPRTTEAGPG